MATSPESPNMDPAALPAESTSSPAMHPMNESCFRELVEQSPDALFLLRNGVCDYINPAGVALFGAQTAEALLGKRLLGLIDSEKHPSLLESMVNLSPGALLPRGETTFHCLDGSLVDVEIVGRMLSDQQQPALQVIAYDISDRTNAMANLNYLAYYDQLTGLPNRILFTDRLEQAIGQAKRYVRLVAVLAIEIDHFTQISTIYGREFADCLLQQLAIRVQQGIRECDTVARHSGHGLYLLITNADGSEQLALLARRLLRELAKPYTIEGQVLQAPVSIGSAIYPTEAPDMESLVRYAEMALTRAESLGNAYLHFSQDISAELTRRVTLEEQLRQAIARDEFIVYYQPQIILPSLAITGAEALVRWNHPEGGMIPAGEFIAQAEDASILQALDEVVLRKACLQNVAWQQAGYPPMRIACNLSSRQFRHFGIVDLVQRVLNDTKLPPECLEMEITETMAIEDFDRTLEILSHLRDIGVQLAIDDFGTGYSSVHYLKQFPVHKINIDRSFLQDIRLDHDTAGIVTAMINLSHALNLIVLAEGVELPWQLEFLRENACDAAQGYLISKPLSAGAFQALLEANTRDGVCFWQPDNESAEF